MICPFTDTPCRYINCPLWNERQGCRFVMAIDKVVGTNMPATNLTSKEQSVLSLLAKGYSNQQVSAALNIGISTVKNHVSNILGKLGAKSRTEAVLMSLIKETVSLPDALPERKN